ncbi:MAG: hypothetical protein ACLSFT_07275 [Ruminococcus callidus]
MKTALHGLRFAKTMQGYSVVYARQYRTRASGDFARHLLANFPSEPVSYLPHASCVHIFEIFPGKYSKIHKGFSPFSLHLSKSDDAICIRQMQTNLIFYKNAREYIKYSLRFVSSDEKFDDASVAQSVQYCHNKNSPAWSAFAKTVQGCSICM